MANINTHEKATYIVDMFENILDKYNIKVPSPEDDEREEGNDAKLYGSVYSDLLDSVENFLVNTINEVLVDPVNTHLIIGRY